ncbi:DUF4097 family beta strand repeat-containing protein [Hymenobacter sp. APR13]|uniref:DUF4097 family beta strand repeat-containing protein n=1 Tax=Hymenobacter sp. APR13 TaxID=1356852 RepID=UPI0004E06814|nr:DUF4097 family beta strand repeat-containing protein [Hymenobacter sp. APR13]AII50620.1 hypothetical protein N008_01305 [Hymenobacter sp. APR13]
MKHPLLALLLALAGPVAAQTPAAPAFQLQCEANANTQLRKTYCETRDLTLPAPPAGTALSVDARLNGSITVRGWDGSTVRVRALVRASSGELAAAQALVASVRISTTNHQMQAARANGSLDDWSVSYEVLVPTRTSLALHATNGGLRLENVQGTITFETTNGSVQLLNLAGDVRGKTTNGSVALTLSGPTWDGTGFDVQTTSGSVQCRLPATYAATLTARTTNGRVTAKLDPATRKQQMPRSLTATFGKGGPQLRLATVNGSVDVQQTDASSSSVPGKE